MRKKLSTSLLMATVLFTGCINTDIGKVDRDAINANEEIKLPEFKSSNTFSIYENSIDVGKIDIEYSGELSYEITGGADAALFTIDTTEGTLSFKKAPDFENPSDANGDNIYEIAVKISAGDTSSFTQNFKITVEDITDTKPLLETTQAYVSQNSLTDTAIAVVKILSKGDSPITSMTLSGDGSDEFSITKDGTVTLKKPLTKAEGQVYNLKVNAINGAGTANASLTITVTPPDLSAPVFSSDSSVSINENETDVMNVKAIDSGFVTYSLVSGGDNDSFSIDPQNGKLSFKKIPDFENPSDANGDNIYEITVLAKDSVLNEAAQNIIVTVKNVYDVKPSIEPLTIEMSESLKAGSKIADITISNSGDSTIDTITLSGEGSENFSVDAQGAITLKNQLFFAQKAQYTLSAVAKNSAGNSDPVAIVINVKEVTDTLPATGQLTSRIDFDDGYYKRGLERSFTKDNDAKIVTDNITSLQWQDIDYQAGINKDLNYTQAVTYCENLVQGGYDDWRVPSSDEFVYLADRGVERILDQNFGFIDDYLTHYWTSTDSDIAGRKWTIELEYGESKTSAITENQNLSVKCVRGTNPLNSNYIRDDQNSVVTDEATNLIWQDDIQAKTNLLTLTQAIAYCEDLTLAGKTGWRLPNFNELYSIVDKSKSNPAIKEGFVNVNTTDYYWSSTSDVYNPTDLFIWSVKFGNGADDRQYAGTVSKHYVRCVHSIK